jgi:carbonic anhydrase
MSETPPEGARFARPNTLPKVEVVWARTKSELLMVQELLVEYAKWVVTLETGAVAAPPLSGLHEEIDALPGVYAPPGGRLLLATKDGEPAGCVCLKPRSQELAEVKRLYVRPSHRGHQIGGLLIERLLVGAKECGYQRIILDSHVSMKSAHQLYEAAGFRHVGPFDDFPKDLVPVAVFMELDLR